MIADLLEFALAQVVEEEVLHGVVGHRDVDQAVAVDVVRGDPQRLGQRDLQVGRADLDARLLADVGEPARHRCASRAQSEPLNDVGGP